jgi:hypothetical protein
VAVSRRGWVGCGPDRPAQSTRGSFEPRLAARDRQVCDIDAQKPTTVPTAAPAPPFSSAMSSSDDCAKAPRAKAYSIRAA